MGATLGHLIICDYNLDTMQGVGSRISIDFGCTDPLVKANTVLPYEKIIEHTHWLPTHKIVRTIHIPLVMERVRAYVHNNTSLTVNADNINVLPIHTMYGGESKGFGTDPVLEQNIADNPGSFEVLNGSGKVTTYHINDFTNI